MTLSINLNAPSSFTNPFVIGDPVQVVNGPVDGLPTLPKVGTKPISSAIYLPTVNGAMTISAMTTSQRNALTPFEGMIIYNTTTNTYDAYFSNIPGWDNVGSGGAIDFDTIYVDNGSADLPSYSFKNDHSTGMWLGGVNILSFSAGGVEPFAINDTGAQFLGVSGIPGVGFFYNETNTHYVGLSAQTVLGGLTSNIVLTLPAATPTVNNEPLLANPGGTMFFSTAGVCFTSMTLSSAQILGMFASPVTVVTAVSGSLIVVHRFIANITSGSTYTGGGNIFLRVGASTAVTNNIGALYLTGGTENLAFVNTKEIPDGTPNAGMIFGDLVITNDTGAFLGGTTPMTIYVWYSIVPVST